MCRCMQTSPSSISAQHQREVRASPSISCTPGSQTCTAGPIPPFAGKSQGMRTARWGPSGLLVVSCTALCLLIGRQSPWTLPCALLTGVLVSFHTKCTCAALLQIKHLRDLNRRGDSESVIRIFESGQAISNEATLGEYVKALVAADRLDTSSLIRTLQVPALLLMAVLGLGCLSAPPELSWPEMVACGLPCHR